MSLRQPPALATWLLNRFHIPQSNPPLAGDLLEEFQSGRSGAWYWRQTVKAIATTLARNARQSRALFPRVFAGWAVQTAIACAFRKFFTPDIPAHVLVPIVMIAISNALIAGLAIGEEKLTRLLKLLDPLRTRFVPLAVMLGLIAGSDGELPWSGLGYVAGFWLGALLIFAVLRPPQAIDSLSFDGTRRRPRWLFLEWLVQQDIASELWRHHRPAQIPWQYLISGAFVLMATLWIFRRGLRNLAGSWPRALFNRVARVMLSLGLYCLIALFVRLTSTEFFLLECALLMVLMLMAKTSPPFPGRQVSPVRNALRLP
jgi:hypothetical protein